MKAYKPKILLLDIENTPLLGYAWVVHEAEILRVVEHSYILSVAWQWYPGPIKVKGLCDFKGYKPGGGDKKLMEFVWNLMNEADIIVAQNGDAFDIKKLNTRFLFHGLGMPRPCPTVDTLKILRARFGLPSNSQDEVCAFLGIGRKLPHAGKETWFGCMDGNRKMWMLMKKYNAHDVWMLQRMYERIGPWAKASQHMNLNLLTGLQACTFCQGKLLTARGWWTSTSGSSEYQRFVCANCGKWLKGPLQKVTSKVEMKSL